jgi:hypothetical protein
MRPGKMSRAGFLGEDEKLEDVLKEDDSTVKNLGLTHEKIADCLKYLVRKHMQIVYDYKSKAYDPKFKEKDYCDENDPRHIGTEIDGKYIVWSTGWMGSQECPWDNSRDCGSMDFQVQNKKTGEEISFPGLMMHLIKEHNFYEGKGTSYRLDPAKAVKVLEITPDADYSIKTTEECVWDGGSGTNDPDDDFIDSRKAMNNAEQVIKLKGGAKAYIYKNDLWLVSDKDVKLKEQLVIDGHKVLIYGGNINRGQWVYHKEKQKRVIV